MFTPDEIYSNIYEINYEFLAQKGIKCLFFDIDNTLVSYKVAEADEKLTIFLHNLNKKFKVCFISNNNWERVNLFNKKFSFPAIAKAAKPLPKNMKKMLIFCEINSKFTAVIGDQIFTDCLAARSIGAYAIIVEPIEPVKTLFFRIKRSLEQPILRRYWRKNSKK